MLFWLCQAARCIPGWRCNRCRRDIAFFISAYAVHAADIKLFGTCKVIVRAPLGIKPCA